MLFLSFPSLNQFLSNILSIITVLVYTFLHVFFNPCPFFVVYFFTTESKDVVHCVGGQTFVHGKYIHSYIHTYRGRGRGIGEKNMRERKKQETGARTLVGPHSAVVVKESPPCPPSPQKMKRGQKGTGC